MKKQKHIPMRIILKAGSIKKLKTMIVEDQESGVKNQTRLEVVTAFLTRHNLLAASFKPIVLFIAINLRSLINPPLEGNWVGNFLHTIAIPISQVQDLEFARLVSTIRSEKTKLLKILIKALKHEQLLDDVVYEYRERFAEIVKMGVEFYSVTTIGNIPWYGIDFKWGKPGRMTVASLPSKNYFIFLDDSSGGGVEAIASLDERVLPILEKDEEFLSFASLDDPLSLLEN